MRPLKLLEWRLLSLKSLRWSLFNQIPQGLLPLKGLGCRLSSYFLTRKLLTKLLRLTLKYIQKCKIYVYSKVSNKRVYSIIIFIFFSHPTRNFSTLFVYLGLLFYEICSKYPPYSFIWACSFMKFAQNIHPTRLFGPTCLIGP